MELTWDEIDLERELENRPEPRRVVPDEAWRDAQNGATVLDEWLKDQRAMGRPTT